MMRILVSITATLVALAGCTPDPQSSSPAAAGRAVPPGNRGDLHWFQAADKPEITPEKIVRDVVGRKVQVSDATGIGPATEWTFEADEFRQAEILESHMTEKDLTIVIFMTTRNNPKPDEDNVQVSGKLQLYYEWRVVRWVLTGIGNLTFRYSLGLST